MRLRTADQRRLMPFFVNHARMDSALSPAEGSRAGSPVDARSANTNGSRVARVQPLPPLATQQAIVAEIEAEQALVAANRELIARFEKKIQPPSPASGAKTTPSAAGM